VQILKVTNIVCCHEIIGEARESDLSESGHDAGGMFCPDNG
jgi:hypothetical protein